MKTNTFELNNSIRKELPYVINFIPVDSNAALFIDALEKPLV
jgi:hypothetical protein